MLAKRIIPCLDINAGRVVKGISFVNLVDAGDPAQCAAAYDAAGADELVLLDITASSDKRAIQLETVKRVAAAVSIPFTVGGGIRSVEDFSTLLGAGAEKVSVNTSAVEDPALITRAAEIFGRQCVVVAMDVKRLPGGSAWEVYTYGGRKATGMDALEWAKKAEALGAGELLVTSMDGDGTKAGYDIPLLAAIAAAVEIPVIASGGAGTPEHFYQALTNGGADAALAASLFHYKELEIRDLKAYLRGKGVCVRL